MTDDWLDAFDPDDLDDPELLALDAAVERLRGAAEPPARRRWPWWAAAAAALAAAAAASVIGVDASSPDADATVMPEFPVAEAPLAPVVEEIAPAEPGVEAAPSPASASPRAPGLASHGETRHHIDGDTAVLTSGVLSYTHDAHHEPGVRRVSWAALPVTAVPVGTAFTLAARGTVGAIRVHQGTVRLVDDQGATLGSLAAGDEWLLVAPHDAPDALLAIPSRGLPLDAVQAIAAARDAALGADAVALVAALRLSTPEEDP